MEILYKCSYCDKIDLDKFEIILHEGECKNNPQNRQCFNCKHRIEEQLRPEVIIKKCDLGLLNINENCAEYDKI